MAKELSNPTFDYSPLSKDEKSKLIYFEGQLSLSRKRVTTEAMKHGEILHGVQQVLANHSSGVFGSWLASVGTSRSSAYNAIAGFVEFGSCPNLDNLEVSAIYRLCGHDGAKKKALALAAKGVKVTHAMALELIESTGEVPKIERCPSDEPDTRKSHGAPFSGSNTQTGQSTSRSKNTPAGGPGHGAETEHQAADRPDAHPSAGESGDPFDEANDGLMPASDEEYEQPPDNGKGKSKTPPKQLDRSAWYKQWDLSIGPLVRLVDKIAGAVGESKCESQRTVQEHLNIATEEMMDWMGVKK